MRKALANLTAEGVEEPEFDHWGRAYCNVVVPDEVKKWDGESPPPVKVAGLPMSVYNKIVQFISDLDIGPTILDPETGTVTLISYDPTADGASRYSHSFSPAGTSPIADSDEKINNILDSMYNIGQILSLIHI